MKHLILLLLLPLSFFVNAQSLDLNQPLPIDKSIKKGVLPNGLTYYIKRTNVVKGAASYYIIQNVGSVLENDDQQGLAHFLEHMAFNGTQTFPGKSMLNTLQKHGAVFGKDINAYTSFDETVYNINNIPTKDSLVDTCLTILNDWSNYLLLTDEEIDAERAVIKEEWRTRQSGQMRLFEISLPIKFNHSKYADRLPIGEMSIVENFDYKTLRNFYHDWYRTDLQAIAVIGDVNIETIEQKIIKKFSKIPAIKNPRERFTVNVPNNDKMMYSLGMDPEVSTANISYGIRHQKPLETGTIGHLKRSLQESMVTSMLNARISEQAQKPEASFLGAGMSYGSMSRTSNFLSIRLAPKPNLQKEAFSEVLTEIERAVKFGFVQSEINRKIMQLKTAYKNQVAKKESVSHKRIIGSIKSNYLENSTISDIEKQFVIVKQIFSTITKEDLHKTIKRLYAKNNRFINVTGVAEQYNLTEADAIKIINLAENDSTIEPYKESMQGKTLVSDIRIKSGKIIKTLTNNELKSTTFLLDNNIKVHYKFVNKEKDKVALNGLSYGGKSLLNDIDLPSANLLGNLIQMSGLGDFNTTDLRKVLAGKTANVRIRLNEISESISGGSNSQDVETMLQMVHLYFVKPRFDPSAFKVLKSNLDSYITSRTNSISEKMNDSLKIVLYGKNNPKIRLFNQEYVSDIKFDKIKSIYESRFHDASDFEFFIVGDVKADQLKPLLEKYIASIPTYNTKEVFIDNGAEWVSDKITEDVYLAMEDPKSTVNILYKKEIPYTVENAIYANVLGDILQLRITETVRETEGGAYSPRANAHLIREPKSELNVSFKFDCNPELADKLVGIVNTELQKIADGNIKEEDLNKTRSNLLKERTQSIDKNAYDMRLLTSFFRYDLNINDPKNFENIVNKVSIKNIQDMASQVLNEGESYRVVFKPNK